MIVVWLFVVMPWVCLQFVIVVFPDHIHLLFPLSCLFSRAGLNEFHGGTTFVDHLSFVFLMLSRLFIAALWSPAGKGLTSWLLLVMFIVFLLLSHVVSWVRCGT